MITVKTNKELRYFKNLDRVNELSVSGDKIIPAGTQFDVNDIIIDRTNEPGKELVMFLCENEDLNICDWIDKSDIEEKF